MRNSRNVQENGEGFQRLDSWAIFDAKVEKFTEAIDVSTVIRYWQPKGATLGKFPKEYKALVNLPFPPNVALVLTFRSRMRCLPRLRWKRDTGKVQSGETLLNSRRIIARP